GGQSVAFQVRRFRRPVRAGGGGEGASSPVLRASTGVHEEYGAGSLRLSGQGLAKAISVLRSDESIELALRIVGGRLALEDHDDGAFDAASAIVVPVQIGRGDSETLE